MSEFKIQKAEGSYKLEDMQKRASVASTADGLTLAGPNFKLGCLTACPDMLLFACEELAKANERVRELERFERIYEEWPELNFDVVKTVFAVELNKFAIEQEIKGLKDYQALCGFADCRKSIDARIAQLEEQLRKEIKK